VEVDVLCQKHYRILSHIW